MEEKKFEFNAKHIFVTVPQSGDLGDPKELLVRLRLHDVGKYLSYGVLAREFHKDNGLHYHFFGGYTKRIH